MEIDELQVIGQRLFGPRWQAPLARAIGIAPETVSRWRHKNQAISRAMENAIQQLEAQPHFATYHEKRQIREQRLMSVVTSQLILSQPENVVLQEPLDVIICDVFGHKPLPEICQADDQVRYLRQVLLRLLPLLSATGRIILILEPKTDPRLLIAVPNRLQFGERFLLLESGGATHALSDLRIGVIFSVQSNTFFKNNKRGDNTIHKLTFMDMLEHYSQATDVICDPFMGEGRLAAVALQLKRQYIGIERERKYWLSSRARLKQVLETNSTE